MIGNFFQQCGIFFNGPAEAAAGRRRGGAAVYRSFAAGRLIGGKQKNWAPAAPRVPLLPVSSSHARLRGR